MFVWVFHRVSGIALIFLMGFQICTGFIQQATDDASWDKTLQVLHTQGILTCLIVFLFIFHSAYGVRTVLLDMGVTQEKPLFWGATGVASVLFVVFLALFLTY